MLIPSKAYEMPIEYHGLYYEPVLKLRNVVGQVLYELVHDSVSYPPCFPISTYSPIKPLMNLPVDTIVLWVEYYNVPRTKVHPTNLVPAICPCQHKVILTRTRQAKKSRHSPPSKAVLPIDWYT